MNRVSVSITNFGIEWDKDFVASSIPKYLQEQIEEAEVVLAASAPGDYPELEALVPAVLIATQAELDFKRLTELVNEPSDKPVLVVRLPHRVRINGEPFYFGHDLYILDGHHRVASANIRGVKVQAVVVRKAGGA